MNFDAEAVWNDPKNSELRARRKDPNILRACDILYVPEPPPPKKFVLKVGATNTFVSSIPTTTLGLCFSRCGKPLANATCTVTYSSTTDSNATDGDGKLTLTFPVNTSSVTVKFPDIGLVRTVRVGHLDPVDEPTGVVQRLRNLRYISAHACVDTTDTQSVSQAIAAFQRGEGVPVTGEMDSATRAKLEEVHGC